MKRSHRTILASPSAQRRQGFTTPAAAVGLIVLMFGLALIVDRIWLETAKLELMIAAESAGLAACKELATDGLLIANNSTDLRINNALQMAESIASQNYVGGMPVTLNINSDGDVAFGNLVQQTQGIQFVESNDNPTTVVVTAQRTRSNNNPVAMFLSGIVGIPYADVAVRVEATVNNDVTGLRPISGTPIPALPIAIWEVDPTGSRTDTWDASVGSATGTDQYSFDTETHTVISGSDGIPELVLHSLGNGNSTTTSNVQLLDLGTGLSDSGITQQFQVGVCVTDLQNLGGQILIGQGATASFNSSYQFSAAQVDALQQMLGQTRICLLYSTATSTTTTTQSASTGSTAVCTAVVAIRIMAVSSQSDGSCDVTVQPTVMTSRTVMLSTESVPPPTSTDSLTNEFSTNVADQLVNDAATSIANNSSSTTTTTAIPNPYVYKLRITH